jgi:ElaB/YqjD/DUF883 family membrane-anchored ribosome-binding protein
MNNETYITESTDCARGLATHARALMAATAEATGEKVEDARKQVASALERGKEFFGDVQTKVIHDVKEVEVSARHHPYKTLGLAVGLGAMIGILLVQLSGGNHHSQAKPA